MIKTIDCEYTRPEFAAAYLQVDGDEAAFFDNNTAYSVPKLLDALKSSGLSPDQVKWVVITHVHLDHAGGTSALMKACPRATLLAHPRAAAHMIDPSKLVASARQVYGDSEFDRLYGKIEAIAADRVRVMDDGAECVLGSTKFKFLHTRGHANHHFCIENLGSDGHVIFTGDAFGLAYPALQREGLFMFPSTSPTDFDASLARASIERIVATGARAAYPTHFGRVDDLQGAREQLLAWIDFSERLLEEATASSLADEDLDVFCADRWTKEMSRVAAERGLRLNGEDWDLLKMDLELNGAGIAHVARKRRRGK